MKKIMDWIKKYKGIIALALLFFIGIIAQASTAKSVTTTINYDPRVDLDYTRNTPLVFSDNEFILNNIYHIKPFVNIANKEVNLTPSITPFSTSITDKLTAHKWSLEITQPQQQSFLDWFFSNLSFDMFNRICLIPLVLLIVLVLILLAIKKKSEEKRLWR